MNREEIEEKARLIVDNLNTDYYEVVDEQESEGYDKIPLYRKVDAMNACAEMAEWMQEQITEMASEWKDLTRLVIMKPNKGRVQVELLNNSKRFGKTAYIYDLYVKPEYRRQGIARELMAYALLRAKDYGFETATLEWELAETPREIACWYSRLGFDEKEFSDEYALMVKELSINYKEE